MAGLFVRSAIFVLTDLADFMNIIFRRKDFFCDKIDDLNYSY